MLGVVHPDGVRDPARVRGRHVEVRVGVRVDIYLVPDITIRLDTMAIYVCDVHCVSIRARNEVLNWHFQSGEGFSRGLLCDCETFANLRLTFV